jgi:hypothetical protein
MMGLVACQPQKQPTATAINPYATVEKEEQAELVVAWENWEARVRLKF